MILYSLWWLSLIRPDSLDDKLPYIMKAHGQTVDMSCTKLRVGAADWTLNVSLVLLVYLAGFDKTVTVRASNQDLISCL